MKMQDEIKIRGHFLIKSYKRDGSVEEWEDSNLIMDTARDTMAQLIAGYDAGVPNSKFVLGTKGFNPVTGNVLEPIIVGENGFVSSRTNLFSEADGSFYYTLTWDTKAPVGPDLLTTANGTGGTVGWVAPGTLDAYAKGNKYNQVGTELNAENAPCPINITITGRTVKYTITIPEIAANGDNGASVIAYTEASLMAGGNIFSMKTMPARVKENTVRLVIEWSLLF